MVEVNDDARNAADERKAAVSKNRVGQRIASARDSLPGERNDLPAGALGGLPVDPQGDENRRPPANAPTIPT
jgi:hypothetical protein